jgi:2,4-dienoyl-CoA reductase-like NADH-dependent reductase (Old Yellow Enzyme family)
MSNYPRVSKLKTADDFRQHVESLGIELPFDEELQTGPDSPLAQSIESTAGTIGNRFSILPMEGWDGTTDGQPTDLTRRRWKNFGLSGAKLIWGGEAVAVQPEGRANPNQLMINDSTLGGLEELRTILVDAHQDSFGSTDDLVVGLQLTHSGRFARPNRKDLLEPRTAYRHPVLDKRFNVDPDSAILSDDELKKLIDDFIASAKLAAKIGFQFVDVKHCHGYLGHELLSGFDRAGEFGGSFENRTKFLRDIVAGIRAEAPSLQIGIRLSVFDYSPFEPGPDGTGVPSASGDYPYAFGGDGTPEGMNLTEPMDFLKLLQKLNIDGYQPPEDPLVGVARQIDAVAKLKAQFPDLIMISSGLSYLQEWLPNVGQYLLRNAMTDSLGLGRMVLSYPELPADALAGNVMQRKKVCRTFSDCTTAPRNGIISGCYPLDPFYKKMPEHDQLKEIKKAK